MEPRHTFKNQTEVFLRSEDNNKCGVRSLNFTTGMNLRVLANTWVEGPISLILSWKESVMLLIWKDKTPLLDV